MSSPSVQELDKEQKKQRLLELGKLLHFKQKKLDKYERHIRAKEHVKQKVQELKAKPNSPILPKGRLRSPSREEFRDDEKEFRITKMGKKVTKMGKKVSVSFNLDSQLTPPPGNRSPVKIKASTVTPVVVLPSPNLVKITTPMVNENVDRSDDDLTICSASDLSSQDSAICGSVDRKIGRRRTKKTKRLSLPSHAKLHCDKDENSVLKEGQSTVLPHPPQQISSDHLKDGPKYLQWENGETPWRPVEIELPADKYLQRKQEDMSAIDIETSLIIPATQVTGSIPLQRKCLFNPTDGDRVLKDLKVALVSSGEEKVEECEEQVADFPDRKNNDLCIESEVDEDSWVTDSDSVCKPCNQCVDINHVHTYPSSDNHSQEQIYVSPTIDAVLKSSIGRLSVVSNERKARKKSRRSGGSDLDFSFLDEESGGDMYSQIKSRKSRRTSHHSVASGKKPISSILETAFTQENLQGVAAHDRPAFPKVLEGLSQVRLNPSDLEVSSESKQQSVSSNSLLPLVYASPDNMEHFDLPDKEFALLKNAKLIVSRLDDAADSHVYGRVNSSGIMQNQDEPLPSQSPVICLVQHVREMPPLCQRISDFTLPDQDFACLKLSKLQMVKDLSRQAGTSGSCSTLSVEYCNQTPNVQDNCDTPVPNVINNDSPAVESRVDHVRKKRGRGRPRKSTRGVINNKCSSIDDLTGVIGDDECTSLNSSLSIGTASTQTAKLNVMFSDRIELSNVNEETIVAGDETVTNRLINRVTGEMAGGEGSYQMENLFINERGRGRNRKRRGQGRGTQGRRKRRQRVNGLVDQNGNDLDEAFLVSTESASMDSDCTVSPVSGGRSAIQLSQVLTPADTQVIFASQKQSAPIQLEESLKVCQDPVISVAYGQGRLSGRDTDILVCCTAARAIWWTRTSTQQWREVWAWQNPLPEHNSGEMACSDVIPVENGICAVLICCNESECRAYVVGLEGPRRSWALHLCTSLSAKMMYCCVTGQAFVVATSTMETSSLTKFTLNLSGRKIVNKVAFEDVSSSLVAVVTVTGLDSGLLGAGESTLYIWNHSNGDLLKTITTSFSVSMYMSSALEQGMLYIPAVLADTGLGCLCVVNPTSGKTALLNKHQSNSSLDFSIEKLAKAVLLEDWVIGLTECGVLAVWSVFTGEFLGYQQLSGASTITLHKDLLVVSSKGIVDIYRIRQKVPH